MFKRNSTAVPAIMVDAFHHFNLHLFGGSVPHVRLELGHTVTNSKIFHGAICKPDRIIFDQTEMWNGSALNCLIMVHEQTHLDVGREHGHHIVWRRRMAGHGLWFNEAGVERPEADGKFVHVYNLFSDRHGIDIYGRRVAA
jgi:hypothetical protein